MASFLRFRTGDKVIISKFYYNELDAEFLESYLKVGYCTIKTLFWNPTYSCVSVPYKRDCSIDISSLIERAALRPAIEPKFDKFSSLEDRVNQFCKLY